jgi:dTDP-4-dehydrorhamnose reductase
MRILVLGSKGQLGRCLYDQLIKTDYEVVYASRADFDIGDLAKLNENISLIRPDIVINASAYTAVDKAENDQQTADLINHLAVANIANACKRLNCWLIHVSTDYVFDGTAVKPYSEVDMTNPQGIYGKSKLNGELAIKRSGCHHIIIRTAWVFSAYGNNFLKTMLRLSRETKELSVVADQIGCPTYAPDLANAIICTFDYLNLEKTQGIYHFAGSPAVSWADFAKQIFDEMYSANKLYKKPNLASIITDDYPTLAKRPANSMLDSELFEKTFDVKPSNWLIGIRKVILQLSG